MKTVILGKTPYRVLRRDSLHLTLQPIDSEYPHTLLLRDPPYRADVAADRVRWGISSRDGRSVTWYRQISDDVFEKIDQGRRHSTVSAPKPDLTPRQINAIVRAADGRNVYLIRTRLGDETVQRVIRARTKGRETEVRSLATGNWIPVLPEMGDRLEVR